MRGRRLAAGIAMTAGAAVAAAAIALATTVRQVQARATGDVEDYLAHRGGEAGLQGRRPVVVAGASIVRGRASVDFVDLLRGRFPDRTLVNAGVNSNVAWELLQRLDGIVACHPAQAVILIGTNDVEATLSPEAVAQVRRAKGLPQDPSIPWFGACMERVVERLQAAGAEVALCSLPPIGQDLSAPVNERIREANAELRLVCAQTGAAYLPVHERMVDVLRAAEAVDGPAWTGSWLPGLRSLVEHFMAGRSFDAIARSRGWLLSPDGVHLDSTGAGIVADAVADWLAGAP